MQINTKKGADKEELWPLGFTMLLFVKHLLCPGSHII